MLGLRQDFDEAAKWLGKATSATRSAAAYFELGKLHLGVGFDSGIVTVDPHIAAQCFRTAGEQGHQAAQYSNCWAVATVT
jgi:TPR repeat protein